MKRFHLKGFVLIIWLLFPLNRLYAYTPQQVSEWTEQTLMTTLTAGYHEKISEAANVYRHYQHKAWRSMAIFFNRYLGNSLENHLRGQQIILQPEPILPAEIMEPEECGEASCWRVHQAFIVPQINRKLEFTAVVATANPAHSSPLIIHSLDIIISPY
jgi:hypothetical protein